MIRSPAPPAAIAVALAALSGYLDAAVFVRLGGYFVAATGGTAVRLGVGLAYADGTARIAGAVLLAVLAGAVGGRVVVRRHADRPVAALLASVTAALTLAALADTALHVAMAAMLLLALAAGTMTALAARDGDAAVGAGGIAAAFATLGHRLADALIGDQDRWAWLPPLSILLGFVAGVTWGARSVSTWPDAALWFAAGIAALLLLATRRREAR